MKQVRFNYQEKNSVGSIYLGVAGSVQEARQIIINSDIYGLEGEFGLVTNGLHSVPAHRPLGRERSRS